MFEMNVMNCDCQQAKTLIALWAGHDLPSSEERNLRRHVSVCPDCKEYARKMKTCVEQLQDCSEPRVQPTDKCLWSNLKSTLQAPEHPRRFNGWTASLALAACFLAMFSIHQTMNQHSPEPVSRSMNIIYPDFVGFEEAQLSDGSAMPMPRVDSMTRPQKKSPDLEEIEELQRRMLKSLHSDLHLFNSDYSID